MNQRLTVLEILGSMPGNLTCGMLVCFQFGIMADDFDVEAMLEAPFKQVIVALSDI